MGQRLDLQAKLVDLLGSEHVYFQAPPSNQMQYPCILYTTDFRLSDWANDKPYKRDIRYLVTVIDRDPDSEIPDKIAAMEKCVFDRFYTADKLNHNVFKLFF